MPSLGPYSAQIQRAILALLEGSNMWTGTNIFQSIGVDGATPSNSGISFSTGGATPNDTASALYSPDGTTLWFNGVAVSGGTVGTTISITNDTTTNATMYPLWAAGTSGDQALKVSSTKLTFNPSAGNMILSGSFTATGNVNSDIAISTTRVQAPVVRAASATILTLSTNGKVKMTTSDASAGVVLDGTADGAVTLYGRDGTTLGQMTTGGYAGNAVIKTSSYSPGQTDYLVVGNHASVSITFTLLTASSFPGKVFVFKNIGVATVTLDATVHGQLFSLTGLVDTITLSRGDALTVISDGTNWMVV